LLDVVCSTDICSYLIAQRLRCSPLYELRLCSWLQQPSVSGRPVCEARLTAVRLQCCVTVVEQYPRSGCVEGRAVPQNYTAKAQIIYHCSPRCFLIDRVELWVVFFPITSAFPAIFSFHQNRTDMRRLTTEICSEKCVVRRFRRCAKVIECTHKNLDSIAY